MGDNDNETLENVRVGHYDFDDDAFDEISDEAKDFINKLLVKDKRYCLLTITRPFFCFFLKWYQINVRDLDQTQF